MQTVLFVSTMTLGTEPQVRELHEEFPIDALANGDSIENIGAYIGSGFYALQIGFTGGDFQQHFRDFVTDSTVQNFFGRLRDFVDELPSASDQTANLHLAVPILFWERAATE